jgi:predicted acylesterase/phospholipase RssA
VGALDAFTNAEGPDRDADPGDLYAAADHYCDIVMKGGITSGVVYPNAICELARTYRFKSVGGTSAGAIAAAATAAAEYGRGAAERGHDAGGYSRLAELGEELAAPGRVKTLFQPQRSTKRLFAVLIGSLEGGTWGAIRAALAGSPLVALLGAAPGAALLVLSILHWIEGGFDALAVLGCVAGVIALLLGGAAAVALRLVHVAARHVPDNHFGICSGASTRSAPAALTPWLTRLLNEAAGLPDGEPLTFGHLWAGPGGNRDHPPGAERDRYVDLQMMTTNLINRIDQRVPWIEKYWYFDPVEFRQLFPEEVVSWMEAHPRPVSDEGSRRSELHQAMMRPRRPLPAPQDLPVVVAARLSLSFPVLLSALPLWRFDFERPLCTRRGAEWDRWCRDQGPGWRAPAGNPREWDYDDMPSEMLIPERCWFSDGGISSNFPIHFFDRPLPGRPTFAINLRPFPLEEDADPADQSRNVAMATTNKDELTDWWYRLPERRHRALVKDTRLPSFLMAAVRTMQTRVDERQMRAPGFRDRIAHVKLGEEEGGMNLTMPPERVEALTERGELAARLLREAYTARADSGRAITWDNHRWVRLRTALTALRQVHRDFAEGFEGEGEGVEPGRSYEELLARGREDPPTSYPLLRPEQLERARSEVAAIRELGDRRGIGGSSLKSPRPIPVARIVPRN